MYRIKISDEVFEDIDYLRKTDIRAYNKLEKLLAELVEHPRAGTGQIELLKYGLSGHYARRINKKHRLVYTIEDDILFVFVISVLGHYGDK